MGSRRDANTTQKGVIEGRMWWGVGGFWERKRAKRPLDGDKVYIPGKSEGIDEEAEIILRPAILRLAGDHMTSSLFSRDHVTWARSKHVAWVGRAFWERSKQKVFQESPFLPPIFPTERRGKGKENIQKTNKQMFSQPKTPATRHRARSDARTPLTPNLVNALNNAAISSSPPKRSSRLFPAKTKPSTAAFDTSNPFITAPGNNRSRPASPVRRTTGKLSDSLQKQAGGGVIRKGGIESRLDIVQHDYVPPPKPELKRSRSTPATVSTLIPKPSINIENLNLFISNH